MTGETRLYLQLCGEEPEIQSRLAPPRGIPIPQTARARPEGLGCIRCGGAMRQRKLGSHTPPCHRRMVITTLFSVLLAALQRRSVLYHTRWLLTVHRHWSSGHLGQLAPTTHPQCRLVSNPCPAGRDPVMHLHSGS